MMVFLQTRLKKILIWQNFLKRESPTLKLITNASHKISFM